MCPDHLKLCKLQMEMLYGLQTCYWRIQVQEAICSCMILYVDDTSGGTHQSHQDGAAVMPCGLFGAKALATPCVQQLVQITNVAFSAYREQSVRQASREPPIECRESSQGFSGDFSQWWVWCQAFHNMQYHILHAILQPDVFTFQVLPSPLIALAERSPACLAGIHKHWQETMCILSGFLLHSAHPLHIA